MNIASAFTLLRRDKRVAQPSYKAVDLLKNLSPKTYFNCP